MKRVVFLSMMQPKVSKGRSESPLVAPLRETSLSLFYCRSNKKGGRTKIDNAFQVELVGFVLSSIGVVADGGRFF